MSEQHETSDSYHGEIVRRGSHRVIICRDGIQYIIQSQRISGGGRWDAFGYCATREGLIHLWRGSESVVPPELEALPDQARLYSPNWQTGSLEHSSQEGAE
ncbi:hypothetical protein ROA7745_00122 [Roseovarius aestuarii]|uniref:Uncharacterized protein n=1 Tax=Roseovarius aestuarii TaxID=475083 RepID=A0A1X7BKY6_9RHOB|nr:hypothetical protein ROA7745_00122 [Roseovarius aestuarii]